MENSCSVNEFGNVRRQFAKRLQLAQVSARVVSKLVTAGVQACKLALEIQFVSWSCTSCIRALCKLGYALRALVNKAVSSLENNCVFAVSVRSNVTGT